MWRFLLAQTEQAVPAPVPAEGAPADPTGGAAQPGNPFGMNMLLMMAVLFGIMYFIVIRPQSKREKERREMLNAVAKGDSVVTTGGICGTIVGLSEERVVLRVDDNVTMEFVRGAISQVTKQAEEGKKK